MIGHSASVQNHRVAAKQDIVIVLKNNIPCTEKCNCSAHCCKNKGLLIGSLSQPRIIIDDIIERTSVNEGMRLDESVCTHHSLAATESIPQNFIQAQIYSHCDQPTSLSWGNLNKDIDELKALSMVSLKVFMIWRQ